MEYGQWKREVTTVKDYYQIDKDHDLNSLLEMGLIKDVASFYEGNIFKYVYRHRNKNGLDDLKKARNYLNLLMELEYGEEAKDAPTDEARELLDRAWKTYVSPKNRSKTL